MPAKKELAVAALRHGTVIDHIPASALFSAVHLLGLESMSQSVTVGNNLPSGRLGSKGIIKVADTTFDPDTLNRIAIIAPTAVVNVIEDYEVVSKQEVVLPEEVVDLVKCTNPKCVTCHEPMHSRFTVVSREPVILKCRYCEHEYTGNGITLK